MSVYVHMLVDDFNWDGPGVESRLGVKTPSDSGTTGVSHRGLKKLYSGNALTANKRVSARNEMSTKNTGKNRN